MPALLDPPKVKPGHITSVVVAVYVLFFAWVLLR